MEHFEELGDKVTPMDLDEKSTQHVRPPVRSTSCLMLLLLLPAHSKGASFVSPLHTLTLLVVTKMSCDSHAHAHLLAAASCTA